MNKILIRSSLACWLSAAWLAMSQPTPAQVAAPQEAASEPEDHYYLLFDVSRTMRLVDPHKDRYEVIPYVHSLMRSNGTLQVYVFSERLLGYEYGNDSLMPPRGHQDFEGHLGVLPFSMKRSKDLEESLLRRNRGDDRIQHVWRITSTTPEAEINSDLPALIASTVDSGWFTDIAHALNEIFFNHIKDSAPQDRHHIIVASDGRPDPFPDYMAEGQATDTYDVRVKDFAAAKSIDRFNGLRSTDKFREKNLFKLRVHERRFKAIVTELLKHGADVRVLLFPPDALDSEDQAAIDDFLLNTGGSRITTKNVKSAGTMADQLIKELLAIGPRAGFQEIHSWQMKEYKTTRDFLVGEEIFVIPPMILSEVFLLARWDSRSCGDKLPGGPGFFFDVDIFSMDDSSHRRHYRIVASDEDSVAGRDVVRWKGFLAELDLKSPDPGLWKLRLMVPRARIKPECFIFDMTIVGRFPTASATKPEIVAGDGANCGGPEHNQYEIHVNVAPILSALKRGSLSMSLGKVTKTRKKILPSDSGHEEVEIKPIAAGALSESDYYFCLPTAVRKVDDSGLYPIVPGSYTLELSYRSRDPKFSQSVYQLMDVNLKG